MSSQVLHAITRRHQNAENFGMLRKSLIGAAAVLGLVLGGSVASSQPASAGYACGPWNGYCGYFLYPGWNYGWYGHKGHNNWNKHGYNKWDNDWNHHKGKGKNKGHAYKNNNWKKYH
jgi:hypothetical protein